MNRKKVGIITFHDADNLGAVLQAFALQTVLEDKCGAKAEIIDYKCDKISSTKQVNKPHGLKELIKYPLMGVYYFIKRRGFDKFRKSHLKCSQPYFSETIKDKARSYDIVISGSDQVWNPECSGDDYTYFLDFVSSDVKKISYAASIGRHKYTADESEKIISLLKDFKALSVREESAAEELERIGVSNIQVHPDPVVLLKPEQWEKYMAKRLHKKPYILVYLVLPDSIVMECAQKYAKLHGYKVICNKKSIEFIMHNSPSEFLSWVYNAECVFTNSFHGTAFSLIFNKPLAADIKLLGGGTNNRVNDFLKKSGAQQCVLDKENINARLPNVQDTLLEMRNIGIEYLKQNCQ